MFEKILEWDGRSVEDLENVRVSNKNVHIILELIDNSDIGVGASWVLKNNYDRIKIKKLSSEIVEKIVFSDNWKTQLHLLKLLEFVDLKRVNIDGLYNKLISLLNNENKFIRSWSYNGLYLIAVHHRNFEEEVFKILSEAHLNESSSVQARIRKIITLYEKNKK